LSAETYNGTSYTTARETVRHYVKARNLPRTEMGKVSGGKKEELAEKSGHNDYTGTGDWFSQWRKLVLYNNKKGMW
jgi:hypothetical protein